MAIEVHVQHSELDGTAIFEKESCVRFQVSAADSFRGDVVLQAEHDLIGALDYRPYFSAYQRRFRTFIAG